MLMILSDVTAVGLSWGAGMALRYAVKGEFDVPRYLALWPSLFLWLLTFGIMGLYRGGGAAARIFVTSVEELRRTTVGTTWAFLFLVAGMYLLQGGLFFSRLIIGVAWLLALVLVPLGRAMLRVTFAHRAWWGSSAVIFGAGRTARQVISILQQRPELGIKPIAVLTEKQSAESEICGVPVMGNFENARELTQQLDIRYCIVAVDENSDTRLYDIHKKYGDCFPHMMVIPELGGLASLWVVARDVGGVLGLEIRHNLLIKGNRWLKRVLDLTVAIPALLLVSPFLAIMVAIIKVVNPGPAFYVQEREGQHGKMIRIWKLRTMYVDAELRLQKLLAENPEASAEWQRRFKLKNDPRILPWIGFFLRKYSLDELPQLWNVINGTMSICGPRPLPNYHLEAFDEEFRTLRRKVLPGMTGLWQITVRSDGDIEAQKRLDTYYIRNWSLWLDLYIIARSVLVVLKGQGAY